MRPNPLATAVLGILTLLLLAPMLWLVAASVDQHASWSLDWPQVTFVHFANVTRADYLLSLWNTMLLALVATVVAVVPGVFGAYALSRRQIPLRDGLMVTVLFLTGIPVGIMIIPVFQIFAAMDWLSLVPTGIFLGANSLPFALWLIKTAMDGVPREMEEAALMERASLLQTILHVVVPVSLPGIASAAIFSFINAWGSFIVPLVLISDPSQQTGPLTIYGLIAAANVRYGDIAAFSIVYSLPVILLYLIVARFFSGGFLLGGAVKG
ncbi:MAG TPA: carbohydrate ABC transporter permease [Acidisoma sp.]|jgi:multiple sugar transport system permease protein|uniref:carbohydrate ABC transporter permease n=1 Tax=Acidisoma sp. TaxID=1872115 RepID=UPI002B80E627|nr:carbohydrate ABC transporter permease [Acidisoma sp.]HTH99593.1 carbohydrate ABC transporter permease [Acidisoma sp.]